MRFCCIWRGYCEWKWNFSCFQPDGDMVGFLAGKTLRVVTVESAREDYGVKVPPC